MTQGSSYSTADTQEVTTDQAAHRPPVPTDSPDLDPLIHAPARLRLCAVLARTDEAEFGWLVEVLKISKSSLSKHATALGDAGYLEQRRAVRNTRQRVWLRLTHQGRTAYHTHVTALRSIVD